jgi:hypothetical protein
VPSACYAYFTLFDLINPIIDDKMMCANLSLFCAYSYASDEDERVDLFIAGNPLTLDTCCYEAEIMNTGWMVAFQMDCVQTYLHWMCMLAVQLSPLDL